MVKPLNIERMDPEMVILMRQKTGADRLRSLSAMVRTGRQLILQNVRSQHPDWNDEQIFREATRRFQRGTR